MTTPFPPKTPRQMAREAEERRNPRRRPPRPGPVDPAKRPLLDGADSAAYLRVGEAQER